MQLVIHKLSLRCTDEAFESMLKANSFLEFLSTVIGKLRLNILNLSVTSTYSRLLRNSKRTELICEYLISLNFVVFALVDDDPHHSASIHTESKNKYTRAC